MTQTHVFSYRAKPWIGVLGLLFFGGGAVVLFLTAEEGARTVFFRTIELSARGGLWFDYFVAVGCAFFALFSLLPIYLWLRGGGVVEITDQELRAPRRGGFVPGQVVIPFSHMVELGQVEVFTQRILNITHREGRYNLNRQMFANREAYEAAVALIRERVPHLKMTRF